MRILKRLLALATALLVFGAVSYPLYVGLTTLLEPVTAATCHEPYVFFVDSILGSVDPEPGAALDFGICAGTYGIRLLVPTIGLALVAYRYVMHR